MPATQVFDVEFQIVNKNSAQPKGNNEYKYRQIARRANVAAVSAHPKDIATVLANNITTGAGETIEVLAVRSGSIGGSEGVNILS